MSDALTVIAGDVIAGRLRRLAGGALQFDYDEAYAASTTATPLSLSMPLTTTHILKPAIAGLAGHDINEHLCLGAARRAGLVTVSSRVLMFGDVSAIVVDRYDRLLNGDTVARIHQEDLCQALSVPPTRKYQSDGGPGCHPGRLRRRG